RYGESGMSLTQITPKVLLDPAPGALVSASTQSENIASPSSNVCEAVKLNTVNAFQGRITLTNDGVSIADKQGFIWRKSASTEFAVSKKITGLFVESRDNEFFDDVPRTHILN